MGVFALLLAVIVGAEEVQPVTQPREWVDKSGKFKVQATFAGYEDDQVSLTKEDGSVVTLPLKRLCETSQVAALRAHYQSMPVDTRPAIGVKVTSLGAAYGAAKMRKFKFPPAPVRNGAVAIGDPRGSFVDTNAGSGVILFRINGELVQDPAGFTRLALALKPGEECELETIRLTVETNKLVWKRMTETFLVVSSAEWEADPRSRERPCPLRLASVAVTRNSINTPVIRLEVENVGQQAVVAYEVDVLCFTRFGDPVSGLADNTNQEGLISQTTIPEFDTEVSRWTLHFRDTTAKVKVVLLRVKLEDGTVWEPAEGQEVAIQGDRPE